MQEPQIIDVPGLLTKKIARRIIIDDSGVKIERPGAFAPVEFIPIAKLEGFRYGMKWIRGYKFPIGRQYFVELKDEGGKVISVNLKSFYGIKRELYGTVIKKIIDQLWEQYFSNRVNYFHTLIRSGQNFELAGVKFLPEGVSWGNINPIPWEYIALSNYTYYFAIHPKERPKEHKLLYFSRDWNALVAQKMLKKIIEPYQQNPQQ
jgi:hypothetical protein